MKISTKLLLIILLAVVLFGMTALAGALVSANLLESQIKDKFMGVSTYAMEKVHRLFVRRSEETALIARDPVVASRRSTARQIAEKLREYREHSKSYAPFASLVFYDLTGRRIAGTGSGSSGRVVPGFGARLPEDRTVLLARVPTDPLNGKAFHLAHVVVDAARVPFGVVVADLPAAALQVIVKRPLGLFKVASAINVDLLDAQGQVLFSTHDHQGIFRNRSPLFALIRKTKADRGGAGTLLVADPEGARDKQIVVFAREEGDAAAVSNGWTLVISLPKRSALAPLLALQNRLALIFLVIGGIAVGIVLLFSRTITRPLARLSSAVTEVGKGNLDAVVPIVSHDEIGRLSAVFNGMVEELRQVHGRLRDAASLDGLTGAYNRKGIEEVLRREAELARRYRRPLSLVLFDLDHFKSVNDTYGHLHGDAVLTAMIGIVKENIRRTDLLGRWGGEEFLLLTPGADQRQAAELAEKLRQLVAAHRFAEVGAVTISCGVATLLEGDRCVDLIKRADDALYRAKNNGRNAVEASA